MSAIQHESAASVIPCSSSFSSASTASTAARSSPVSDYAVPADTASFEEAPLSLSRLERHTRILEEERLHYAQLGQRAADAFEAHRRELTQLVQKERAIRGHREDVLRAQLQETLQANRELMARVSEQRRQREEEWVAELQGHRGSSTGQDELESTLRQLHEEWVELRRDVAETEASHEEHRRSLAACLRDQESLRSRVRSLQDGLRGAEAAVAAAEQLEEVVADGRGQTGSAPAPVKSSKENWVKKPSSRTSVAASPQLTQYPRCSYCDMPPKVWDAPSPTRRAPCRHFVPSGPWDACSPCRASSPCTHNVEAMVATIERGNYLRPRLYYHRVGCEPTDVAGAPVAAASPYRQRRGGLSRARPPPPPPAACASSFCASATPPRTGDYRHLHNCQHSPGLSSSSTSSCTRTPDTHTTTGSSSSLCSCSACAPAPASATVKESTPSPSARHRDERRREASPYWPRSRCFSPRTRGERPRADAQASAGVRMPPHHSEPTIASSSLPAFHRVPLPPPRPAADGLHGAALNATCRALITDLADMRAEYRRCQHQLRDMHGDSVAASQAMRRLMHEMDSKAAQIHALRLEQGRHNNALRVRDVLREVMAENRYCEAVYSDLLDLIRT
ncbi:conserved hypothetical protein [Leishmania major strain Friedlin]|uniref:Uncharacterized protein n=1 Tax=Leishmania major TaxID=5664 RepID=Q4Q834_LEIMA|nr:conserved hypothetical protein [Leishmania major strain Friedlin]CAG9577343.1 hypothetical_protein_-_conserved [Leishmania major strain Friedlin]CAJ05686.1 conserved hypothetical protein [Leishmania major strain Friedlin]|eukprot:XP_001684514.1 conserved hypothetical protein [Leishmania major strain Friedlin]